MPLPVITSVSRVVFHWDDTDSDTEVVSVQHFNNTGDDESLADALDAEFVTDMLLCCTDATEVLTVDITPLDGVSAATSWPLTNWQGNGGSTDRLPGVNALVLGQTGLRGSANRGRLFIPSIRENCVEAGLLNAGIAASMQTAWNTFREGMSTAGKSYGVASYVTPDFTPYVSMTVPRNLGFIRRRRNRS